jgi:hypothetical protein
MNVHQPELVFRDNASTHAHIKIHAHQMLFALFKVIDLNVDVHLGMKEIQENIADFLHLKENQNAELIQIAQHL